MGQQCCAEQKTGLGFAPVPPERNEPEQFRSLLSSNTNARLIQTITKSGGLITETNPFFTGNREFLLLGASPLVEWSLAQLMRYEALFSFYTQSFDLIKKQDPQAAKRQQKMSLEQFIDYAKIYSQKNSGQEEDINSFLNDITKAASDQQQKQKIILECFFKKPFLANCLNSLFYSSSDPKDLCGAAYPIYYLYNAIKRGSNQTQNSRLKNQKIIIVVNLSPKNKQVIQIATKKQTSIFLTFPIFVRGFLDRKAAKNRENELKKTGSTFVFTVTVDPSNIKNGLYIYPQIDDSIKNKGEVLFNLTNYFLLNKNFHENSSRLNLFFHSRTEIQESLLKKNKSDQRQSSQFDQLSKIISISTYLKKYYLKSQSGLFSILGDKEQSLRLSNILSRSVLNSSKMQTQQKLQYLDQKQNLQQTLTGFKNIEDKSLSVQLRKTYTLVQVADIKNIQQNLRITQTMISSVNNKNFIQFILKQRIKARIELCARNYEGAKQILQDSKDYTKHDPLVQDYLNKQINQDLQQLKVIANFKGLGESLSIAAWKPYLTSLKFRTLRMNL